MKILALGDPHGKLPKNLYGLVKKNKVELIVCVGDVPPVPKGFRKGRKSFTEAFIKYANERFDFIVKKLCSFGLPVIVLRGNMYLTGSRNELTKQIFGSHNNLFYKKTGIVKIKGKNFILFDMSFEPHMYSEPDSWMKMQFKLNKSRKEKMGLIMKKYSDAIIVSHAPPFSVLDETEKGNRGSKILLEIIKKYRPSLVLCGHIHECKGRKKIGRTEVFNLGWGGNYKILEV